MVDSQLILELFFCKDEVTVPLRCYFLPDARGDLLFYLSAFLYIVRPTYRASHRHNYS